MNDTAQNAMPQTKSMNVSWADRLERTYSLSARSRDDRPKNIIRLKTAVTELACHGPVWAATPG